MGHKQIFFLMTGMVEIMVFFSLVSMNGYFAEAFKSELIPKIFIVCFNSSNILSIWLVSRYVSKWNFYQTYKGIVFLLYLLFNSLYFLAEYFPSKISIPIFLVYFASDFKFFILKYFSFISKKINIFLAK